jgi:AraC family transcriptional regulator
MERSEGRHGESGKGPSPQPLTYQFKASRTLDVVMASARYAPYEGPYDALPYLGLYLCTGGGGPLARRSQAQDLEGVFTPGRVGLGAPHIGGTGYGPDMALLALGISQPQLDRIVEELPGRNLDIEAAASRFHDDPLLSAALGAMWREAQADGLTSAFVDHALAVTVHRLARGLGDVPAIRAQRLSRQQVSKVVGFIDAHLEGDITVAQLASLLDYSPNHFSRCFRATTGLPPYAFLMRKRLDRAADLLSDTDLDVTEIAAMTGYLNPSQFSSAFKRHKGLSPRAWRQGS